MGREVPGLSRSGSTGPRQSGAAATAGCQRLSFRFHFERRAMALNNVAVNNSHAARWKHERLFSRGYLAVPIAFLEHYARLKKYGGLTHAEAMFILHVMSFKWGERAPFPSYATLAKRMGTGPKT